MDLHRTGKDRQTRKAVPARLRRLMGTAYSDVELGDPFFFFPDVIITHSYLYERTCSARVEG